MVQVSANSPVRDDASQNKVTQAVFLSRLMSVSTAAEPGSGPTTAASADLKTQSRQTSNHYKIQNRELHEESIESMSTAMRGDC